MWIGTSLLLALLATMVPSAIAQTVPRCTADVPITHHVQMSASNGEIAAFTEVVTASKGSKYFEFGSGGSTDLVLRKTNLTVVSIDSDASWLCKLRTLADGLGAANRFLPLYVDVGETKAWGMPKNEEDKHKWPKYAMVIQDHKDADVVFVDGRFRVACLLNALLSCKNETIFMVHDFWNRKHYHVVLPFVDVKKEKGSLLVATRKYPFDRKKSQAILVNYLHDKARTR